MGRLDGRDVHWGEGMLLVPQHLQCLQRSVLEGLDRLRRAGEPFGWGVAGLLVDRTRLAEGRQFRLESCELVLPDGTYLRFPGNARLEPLDLGPTRPGEAGPTDIYVVIPPLRPAGPNQADGGLTDGRWSVEEVAWPDENLGPDGEDPTIGLRLLNARLVAGGPPFGDGAEGWALRVAAVRFVGEAAELVEDVGEAPPLLNIGAWPALNHLADEVRSALADALRELRRLTAVPTGSLLDVDFRLRRLVLEQAHAAGADLLAGPSPHPHALFRWLSGLAAALDAWADQDPVAGRLPYDHGRPGPALAGLRGTILAALGALPAVVLRFQPGAPAGPRRLKVDPAMLRVAREVVLTLTNPPGESVACPEPHALLLGFQGEIEGRRTRRSGLPLRAEPATGPSRCYRVEARAEDWEGKGTDLVLETARSDVAIPGLVSLSLAY